ncbi:unnamed protein product, partial [Ixodes hexagonus]
MLTNTKPAGAEVFMGLVTTSSMASSANARNILKIVMSSVRADIVILETHAFKGAGCLGNPYTNWTGPDTLPFEDPNVSE